MAYSFLEIPPIVGSVGDDLQMRLHLNFDYTFTVVGSAPYGLLEINAPISSYPLGTVLYITDTIYKGNAVIVQNLGGGNYILNVPWQGASAAGHYAEIAEKLYLFRSNRDYTSPVYIASMDLIIDSVANSVINVSEILKSVLKIGTPVASSTAPGESFVFYYIDNLPDGSGFHAIFGPTAFCAINSTKTNAELAARLTSGSRYAMDDNRIIFPQFYGVFTVPQFSGTPNILANFIGFTTFVRDTSYVYRDVDFPAGYEIFKACYQEGINIVFMNDQGGWQNYVLSNEYRKELTFSQANKYRKPDRSERFSLIESNQQITYTLKGVRCAHAASIEQMIKSVQAYIWNADNTFTPIIIDKQSFIIYETFRPFIDAIITYSTAGVDLSQLN